MRWLPWTAVASFGLGVGSLQASPREWAACVGAYVLAGFAGVSTAWLSLAARPSRRGLLVSVFAGLALATYFGVALLRLGVGVVMEP